MGPRPNARMGAPQPGNRLCAPLSRDRALIASVSAEHCSTAWLRVFPLAGSLMARAKLTKNGPSSVEVIEPVSSAARASALSLWLDGREAQATDADLASLAQAIAHENDRDLLHYRLVAYLLLALHPESSKLHADPQILARAVSEIPPDHSAWSLHPQAIALALLTLDAKALAEQVISRHADYEVVGAALLFQAHQADFAKDEARLRRIYETAKTRASKSICFPVIEGLAPDSGLIVGQLLPEYELADAESSAVFSTRKLPGRYTLLLFWSTWCKGCREHAQALEPIYARYRSQGFEIVTVHADDAWENVQAFRRDVTPMPWKHSWQGEEKAEEIKKAFRVSGYPDAYLADARGTLLAKGADAHPAKLNATLDGLLDNRRRPPR
jgi:thiol-disulfide isomerase/thioredoxin